MELNLYIQFAVFTLLFSFTFLEACGYTPKLWDRQQSCSSLNRWENRNIQDQQNCPVLQSLTVTKLKKNEEFWTFKLSVRFVIQLLSCVQLFVTPWTPWKHVRLPCPSPSPRVCSNSCPLIVSVMLSSHLLCRPLLLLPSIFPSLGVFSNESVPQIRWPEYWSFSFSISPSNQYSELISFRIDWFDFLAVQGSLKSLFQHTIQKHQFFGSQPSLWSNSYIHTWLLEKP